MDFNVGNLDNDFTTDSRDGNAMSSHYSIANVSSLLHVARADARCSEVSSLTSISKVRSVRLEEHSFSASQTNEAGLQQYTPSLETLLAWCSDKGACQALEALKRFSSMFLTEDAWWRNTLSITQDCDSLSSPLNSTALHVCSREAAMLREDCMRSLWCWACAAKQRNANMRRAPNLTPKE